MSLSFINTTHILPHFHTFSTLLTFFSLRLSIVTLLFLHPLLISSLTSPSRHTHSPHSSRPDTVLQGEGSSLLLSPCDPSRPYTLKCIFHPSDPLWLQEGVNDKHDTTRAKRVPECSVHITVKRATTRIEWEAPVMPISCGMVLTSDVLCAKIVCDSDNSDNSFTESKNGGNTGGSYDGDDNNNDKGGLEKQQDKSSAVSLSGVTAPSLTLTSVASRGLTPFTAQGLALSLIRYRLVETDTPLRVGVSTITEPGIYTIR